MHRIAAFVLAVAPLIGCAPDRPQHASVEGPPITSGYLSDVERSSAPPQLPWPAFRADLAALANRAEMAIIWRGHELRERHPGATPAELAQMLARDVVWEQNAKLVPPARRIFVTREALMFW